MGRQPDGNYVIPDGTYGSANQTIYSARYNNWVNDIAATLNAPLPVNKGGTGSTTAPDALVALGAVAKAGDTMTGDLTISKASPSLIFKKPAAGQAAGITSYLVDKPRWVMALGNATPESGSNAGSDFTLYRYDDAGTLIGAVLDINRASGQARFDGDIRISKANPALRLDKAASGQLSAIEGDMATKPRWVLNLGDASPESGSNSGSDFVVTRFDDNGTLIGQALNITRANGAAALNGNLSIVKASPQLILNKGVGASDEATIYGNRNSVNRWAILMAQGAAETGANAGSDFALLRYADNGAYLGVAFSVTRSSGALQFNAPVVVNGGYLVVMGSTPTQGTIYFGNTGTKILTYDGTYFQFNGAPLIVNGAVWSASNSTSGTYQFGLSGGKYLTFDGSNFQFVGAQLIVNGPLTTSNNPIYGGSINASANFICQAANPVLWMRDAGGNNKGYFLWEPANNEVYFHNAVAGYGVTVEASGGVKVGTGMRCRPGAAGAYGGNIHNIGFSGAAQMWIDLTNQGQIAYTSDYRIKKDVADLHGTWDVVKALRPISYTQAEYTPTIEVERKLKEAKDRAEQGIKEDKLAVEPMYVADDIERWGFIAHELQATLIQSAASAYKDAPDAVQSPNPWTVIAALTKALQEAMARIEALEAQ